MRNVVVLASGTGSLLQALIDSPARGEVFEIKALLTDRPDCSAINRAKAASIETVVLPYRKDNSDVWQSELTQRVLSFQPDLVVSAGFMRIIKSDLFNLVPTINAHPSLLPNFPGANAVADALAAGSNQTGATIHYIDQGIDTGTVIAQTAVAIHKGDTVETLHERIKAVERDQLVAVVVKLCQQSDLWAGIN